MAPLHDLKILLASVYAFRVHGPPVSRDHWCQSWLMEKTQFQPSNIQSGLLHLKDDSTALGPFELQKIGRFLGSFRHRSATVYQPSRELAFD